MSKNALIIFTRNPELGKCKTRLAKTIGDKNALDVYKYLLQHTADVSLKIDISRYVFYSETISEKDIWETKHFNKKLQKGDDLGQRMQNAFEALFRLNYDKVIIIGSDLLDLNESIIENAFNALDHSDVAIGPAKDGGYYLLGMKKLHPKVFNIKAWGTETVYKQTISKLNHNSVYVLETLNDIDYVEDLKPYKVFQKYFKKN
ncbi:TIGR04282 family arsenosugar biosynthesis glycosyltransferase [Winogradskyella sp. PG-2]|uniref:TIGR04282 family arsenosugar biosynthesis glycosyltransferase n=1 Tax=Winogradskyella sp. PG-2 TaxID=754409 RepID=UPI0004585C9E|nr:TIGR04282 family arsenosugar biosynthesis glycosyltransferase [Winogradskyella sp. PG-2]BAO76061.1 glycosyltransferase [Winogradskyella sp. PG-2]